jgi:uncharacterized YigZ family protein
MTDRASFITIESSGEGEYREKGSRFIGYGFHCMTEDAFKLELERIKKEHHQARHYCFAYVLEEDASIYRSNDDGEPNGTAGKPILAQLNGSSITYGGVVVVRYFGGTKLGKGGLVRAYGNAAKEAIENSILVERPILVVRRIKTSIDLGEKLKGRLLHIGCEILDARYDKELALRFSIPVAEEPTIARYCNEHGIDYRID